MLYEYIKVFLESSPLTFDDHMNDIDQENDRQRKAAEIQKLTTPPPGEAEDSEDSIERFVSLLTPVGIDHMPRGLTTNPAPKKS